MQTLISVFNDRAGARRAMERLQQAGIPREDMHLQASEEAQAAPAAAASERAQEREIGDRTMDTAEREVAVDRNVMESVGHFFVSLFGRDRGEGHVRRYGPSMGRGQCVVVVDVEDDAQAEAAATILHDQGAVDVDDHADGRTAHGGVHAYSREPQPRLRDLVDQRRLREESILADRAADVSRDAQREREQREERAYAAGDAELTRDRPI